MADTEPRRLLLALDTSGPACSVALADMAGGLLMDAVSQPMQRGHAEAIVQIVDDMLTRNSAAFSDIAKIAVCIGPGSFAGLRVGLSAAKGFGLATGADIVGISAFDAHAHNADDGDWVVLDGRRGEAFVRRKGDAQSARRLELAAASDFDFAGAKIHGPFALDFARAAGLPEDQIVRTADVLDISHVAQMGLEADTASHPATLDYMRGADAKPGAGFSIARAT